jgi:peptide chain release factor
LDYVKAFHSKMRTDAVNARTVTDPAAYEQHIQLTREIADILRRNVVQALKVKESTGQGEEKPRWSQ